MPLSAPFTRTTIINVVFRAPRRPDRELAAASATNLGSAKHLAGEVLTTTLVDPTVARFSPVARWLKGCTVFESSRPQATASATLRPAARR